MGAHEYPRIGNRSDALELLEKVIGETEGMAGLPASIGLTLMALKDAVEREVL
jgi:hypothetical protein